jgi:hypothetical protein
MVFLVCSCDNNRGQQLENNREKGKETEKYFSYQILLENDYDGKNRFKGLAILYGDDNSSNYVMFDNDEDYYNDCIREWTLAWSIAQHLYYFVADQNQIESYLKTIHCLPNCFEKYGITDDKIKGIFLKQYYDNRELKIYEPQRYYGMRIYSIENQLGGVFQRRLYRIEDELGNIPTGTLGIR